MKKSSNSLQQRLLEKFLISNNIDINHIKNVLDNLWEVDTTIGVSLVDWKSELILGLKGNDSFDIEYATSDNNYLIKMIMANIKKIEIENNDIKDIVMVLSDQIHITSYIDAKRGFFLYLVLDAKKTNLALARSKIEIAVDLLN